MARASVWTGWSARAWAHGSARTGIWRISPRVAPRKYLLVAAIAAGRPLPAARRSARPSVGVSEVQQHRRDPAADDLLPGQSEA